ncbi:MAG: hypothetical protein NVSMB12_03700 [Acidimicrobiales bacterium]
MPEVAAFEHGVPAWVDLGSADLAESVRFYSGLFGWEHEDMEMVPAEVPNHWLVHFATSDTDASAANVTELGGTVLAPPFDGPPGRMAVFADPRGAAFAVIAMAAQ